MIDTHAHYDKDMHKISEEQLVENCFNSGLTGILFAGTDLVTSKQVVDFAKRQGVHACVGVHPSEVDSFSEEFEKFVVANKDKVVAIGEIGLDYYWKPFDKEKQQFVFSSQLDLASRLNLPVVIHQRECTEDCLKIVKTYNDKLTRKGVIHCFSGSVETAKEYVKMGFALGIGGIMTYKNANNLLEVVKSVGLNNIVLETDSPYLSPEPVRHSVNIPSNVVYVAKRISEVLGVDYDLVIKKTDENAERIFALSKFKK